MNPELFIGSIECIKLERKMLEAEYEQTWDIAEYHVMKERFPHLLVDKTRLVRDVMTKDAKV